jgi:CHAT domain-containing protein
MKVQGCLAALGAFLLGGCTSSTPDGNVLLDESVPLTRRADIDSARREIDVEGGSAIVAIVDESPVAKRLTDVSLTLEIVGTGKTLTVENGLRGAGLEIAVLRVPRAARVAITLTGPPESATPGQVGLRVQRFDEDSKLPQLAAYRGWSAGTLASHRADNMKASGLAALEGAIAVLAGANGDPALAARARLIKANALHNFRFDERESRDEARRAAAAFKALAAPDELNEARARLIEALALMNITEGVAENPTPEEAVRIAREIFGALLRPESPFGPIERGRTTAALASLDMATGNTDDGMRRHEEARAIYQAAGFIAGEREARCRLASSLVTRGQFGEGAAAFEKLLPELDALTEPDVRAGMYAQAGRAMQFAGRADEALELLHKAIAISRENRIRIQEASALQNLGNIYLYRVDWAQAGAFYSEVLRITAEENDVNLRVPALQTSGYVAREEGRFDRAIELHREAVRISANPIARIRSLRELGMTFFASGDYREAEKQLRAALAVKMQDPRHHAYSDIKRNLVQAIVANGELTPALLAEARQLAAESLEVSEKVGDKVAVIGAHRVKAELHAAAGETTQARAMFERALALAHEYREKSASGDARIALLSSEQASFRGLLDLDLVAVAARGENRLRAATPREEHAIRRIEIARDANHGLLRTGDLDADTVKLLDGLFGRMADTSLKISTMNRRELNAAENANLESLQLQMSDLYAELDRARVAAALKRATAEKFRPNTARALRTLAPGVVQLSYALGNDHVYAWVRDRAGIRVTSLALRPNDLEHELATLGELDRQRVPREVERALERVSGILLPPSLLPADSTAIEIIAEGRVAGVPFAGLRSPSDPARRLVETHAITMITSMLAPEEQPQPQRSRAYRFVALASGSGSLRSASLPNPLPRLNAAKQEIRAAADLFLAQDPGAKIKLLSGAEGNAAALRNIWSSGADVVHFATHSLADLRQPLASLLVLPSTDAGTPAYLTAGQVQAWRGDADLVFLSACESAIGPPRFASGMPGLQSAFLRAGARGVIATLWPIEDVLAREFSEDFYERYTATRSATRALSETQRQWLTATPGVDDEQQRRRRITALAHGFYTL